MSGVCELLAKVYAWSALHAAETVFTRPQVFISTGAGALAALPDSKVQDILARMRPEVRQTPCPYVL